MGWPTFEQPGGTFVLGAGFYTGQRVSLAGVEGRLAELGAFQVTWAYERVAVRLGGTLFRLFDDQHVFAEPYGDARPPDGTTRRDAGDIRVSTIIRLTAEEAKAFGIVDEVVASRSDVPTLPDKSSINEK